MPDTFDKPLIAPRRPEAVRLGTRLGRIIAKLHAERVAYRYWHGREAQRELTGCGQFIVEVEEGQLRCCVLGDLFKPGPFEFVFHRFWLTRRGMILAVFDLAENRPPGSRSGSETFLHLTNLRDSMIRREAVAFRDRPMSAEKRKPS